MIVKVQHFKKEELGVWEEEIYANVERVYKFRDLVEDEFLHLKIKGQEDMELVPVTRLDEEGNHQSVVGCVWLMNDEGKTIEKLV